MRNLSAATKFNIAFAVAGLVLGAAISFPLVRVETPTKTVTHTIHQHYKLQNGASAQSVYNTLGSPVGQKAATASNPFTCAEFVGHIPAGQQTPSDWYAIYCFRTN